MIRDIELERDQKARAIQLGARAARETLFRTQENEQREAAERECTNASILRLSRLKRRILLTQAGAIGFANHKELYNKHGEDALGHRELAESCYLGPGAGKNSAELVRNNHL